MTTTKGLGIPYEAQIERETNRACGAAALAMVYRSLPRPAAAAAPEERIARPDGRRDRRTRAAEPLDGVDRRRRSRRGVDVSQAEILPGISASNAAGQASCRTHLMVRDALSRGYSAVAIRARQPLQALAACERSGIRAVLNHRLRADDGAGHFSVLVGMGADSVTVHDPYFGPSHRIPFGELLELWRPGPRPSEIVGEVLIGISSAKGGADDPAPTPCGACGVVTPREVACPRCGGAVPLRPRELLGCAGAACILRSWTHVCCPACDFMWGFEIAPPAEPGAPADGLWDLGPLFAELDKFEASVLGVPAAARNPDVQAQLASIRQNRARLRLAEQEEISRRKEVDAHLRAMEEQRLRGEAELAKAKEAAAPPAAPIDAAKLGDALLKDLGIVKG